MSRANQIIIYDRDNEEILSIMNENEGKYLDLSEISEDFVACFLASEDASFYDHHGFSLKGIIRALYSNVRYKTSQGGSTITQQLSRILFLNNEKTLHRKIKEGFITVKLESNYEKKEIIEEYLNNIFLGHNVYGIEQASRYYFNKSCNELSLDEMAMIAGIANSPNTYAPDVDKKKANVRRNYVLKRLYEENYIDNEKYQLFKSKETKIDICSLKSSSIYIPIYNYIKSQIHLLNLDYKNIMAKGLKIYTTIDSNVQKEVVKSVKENNPDDNSSIGVIVSKSNSGDILALCNGYDLNDEYINPLQSVRPIGSTIKPMIYYLALRDKFDPLTKIDCQKTSFKINEYGTYSPDNASKKYAKDKITLIEAIGLSDNIYAVKTLLYLGIGNLERFLSLFDIKKECVPSSALGVDEMTLLDLIKIYSTFSSLGSYYTPRIIRKITDTNNNIYISYKEKSKILLAKKECLILSQLLTSSFDSNLIDYTKPTLLDYKPKYTFAAKTGSDNSNSYTIGYNPNYVIGIWSGMNNNESLNSKNITKKNFQQIANAIEKENIWYGLPFYLKSIVVDPIKGIEDKNGSVYWFPS